MVKLENTARVILSFFEGSTPSPPTIFMTDVDKTRVEYWLQIKRPNEWLDYGLKGNIKMAFERIEELKQEVPGREFRCIARTIRGDRVLSPNAKPESSGSLAPAGYDESAWPLKCIVEKLIEAADILLDEKDYDGHGHELISFARNEARNWLRQNERDKRQ